MTKIYTDYKRKCRGLNIKPLNYYEWLDRNNCIIKDEIKDYLEINSKLSIAKIIRELDRITYLYSKCDIVDCDYYYTTIIFYFDEIETAIKCVFKNTENYIFTWELIKKDEYY